MSHLSAPATELSRIVSVYALPAPAFAALKPDVYDRRAQLKRKTPANIAFKFDSRDERDIFVPHILLRDNIVPALEALRSPNVLAPRTKMLR